MHVLFEEHPRSDELREVNPGRREDKQSTFHV